MIAWLSKQLYTPNVNKYCLGCASQFLKTHQSSRTENPSPLAPDLWLGINDVLTALVMYPVCTVKEPTRCDVHY